jgi:sarcosine oxidase subunit beta
MTTRAAVAIIGGGVIGASIAYHLTRHGVRDIVILERAPGPGLGSTGKATGGFRSQFATAINVRLSLLSREMLLRFMHDTGVDPGYSQVGYLWLAETEQQLRALKSAQALQHSEGLTEAVELAPEEIHDVNSVITTDGVVGAAFCPTDGYINPLGILRGYLEAAEGDGVRTMYGSSCLAVSTDKHGHVTTVRTHDEEISVETVVNAAGPWAAGVASLAGLSLPVAPLRRQAAYSMPCPQLPPNIPLTIFMESGFHIRAKLGRALICWPQPEKEGEPAELRADDEWIAAVASMAHQRVPILRDVGVDRSLSYAGLYEMSPDNHAMLGRFAQCENMYFANGSSGHGVMHSPAIGAILADMIVGAAPRLDVSILRPSRFEEGAAIASSELL